MREFTVVTQPAEEEQFTKEVIRTTDGWSIYGGSDANLIDGDLTTKVHYNVRQKGEPANTTIPGDYVGVKLSKPITLGKINILQGNTDSDGDYFKDADLQYSLDGKTWTTVETYKNTINIVTDLSDQNITAQYVRLVNKVNQNTWIAMREFDVAAKVYHNGKVFTNVSEYKSLTADYLDESAKIEAENTDEIGFVLPSHEISYNAKKVDGLNLQARYLKFEITRTKVGADKWVRFQELEINNGEFIPSQNNPTFTSSSQETRDGLFSYMVDGDISTMFIPKDANGYVNYSLSSNNQVNTIKIIQNSAVISNAVVKARLFTNASAEQWVTLGTLSQAINEFVLPENTILLDIKVEWGDVIPNITELSTYKSEVTTLNVDALKALIDNKEDLSSWTAAAAATYGDAYNAGKQVLESEYASQTTVDNAVRAINKAIENKVLKCDLSKLEIIIANAHTDQNNYTAASWLAYSKAIEAINKAIANGDNTSVADVDKLIANYDLANTNLVFNPSNQEEAIITIEGENDFVASVTNPEKLYTINSWKIYLEAKAKVEQLIIDNQSIPVHPDEFAKAISELAAAKEKLVVVGDLKDILDTANKVNQELYTTSSYKGLADAIAEATARLENGTAEEIDASIKALDNALKALVVRAKADEVKEYINSITLVDLSKYTESSAKIYQEAYNVLKAMLDNLSDISAKEFIEAKNNFETAVAKLEEKATVAPIPTPTPNELPASDSAKTGDDVNIFAYVTGLGVVAIVGIYWLLRKKEE